MVTDYCRSANHAGTGAVALMHGAISLMEAAGANRDLDLSLEPALQGQKALDRGVNLGTGISGTEVALCIRVRIDV